MKRRNISMHGHTTFFVSLLPSQRRGFSLSQRRIEDLFHVKRAAITRLRGAITGLPGVVAAVAVAMGPTPEHCLEGSQRGAVSIVAVVTVVMASSGYGCCLSSASHSSSERVSAVSVCCSCRMVCTRCTAEEAAFGCSGLGRHWGGCLTMAMGMVLWMMVGCKHGL